MGRTLAFFSPVGRIVGPGAAGNAVVSFLQIVLTLALMAVGQNQQRGIPE